MSDSEGQRLTKANLRTFLDLSTAHLTVETREYLDTNIVMPGTRGYNVETGKPTPLIALTDFGWWVFASEDMDPDWPQDLKNCMVYARHLGTPYLLFDADAEVCDDLPVYDTPEPAG